MTPHITAELWARRHDGAHIHELAWPTADPAKLALDTVTMVVQVNGKVRDKLDVPADIDETDAERRALASTKVQAHLDGATPAKVIVRPPKLVNLVV
jgi:leucyl-tRNA synthetase